MIRSFHLADLFTIANGFCGAGAIFEAMKYLSTHDTRHLYLAALLVPVALVFDVLDGRIARWRHSASPMGRELDSLADVISFGVAPAAIAFAAGVNSRLDQVILLYFTGCGVSRLARYNVTAEALSEGADKVKYFEGTPIPTSVVLVGVLALAAWQGRIGDTIWGGAWSLGPWVLHPLCLLFGLSGTLMVSKTLRIPKF
jgi:CDP-diacylglycerol--serine O-phosphatidyltransferase